MNRPKLPDQDAAPPCTCDLCRRGLADHILCNCGRPVEQSRRCYAIPTCYTCLLPPEAVPVVGLLN